MLGETLCSVLMRSGKLKLLRIPVSVEDCFEEVIPL